ncbi:MAG: Asp-tRNA(Asn)/Glu-tRNA(Gln) amidotransferase subunit GatA [Candidatus Diapherotrites archaeon]|nr:Asp-tRNA(Asn)/Glu-tRNA(Gln) amidotransferase subunit GatA [Candidatus Diapherotrites archaeon]
MNAIEFVQKAQNAEISVVEHTHKILEEIKKKNPAYNHFNLIAEDFAIKQAEELEKQIRQNPEKAKSLKLLGLPVSVKDCICVKGIESRSGSKILSGYKPVFDATVVAKAKEQGAIILGKTSQDEFGFGSFGTNTGIDFKKPKNPHDVSRACGGSSAGAGGFTALTEFSHIALGESTGGSIACPASFCGVVGLTPTYGRVSRYGLIDYANSLDKIGTIAKSTKEAALLLQIISGNDEKDATSLKNPAENYIENLSSPLKGMKIAVIREFFGKGIDSGASKACWSALKAAEKTLGVKYEEVSLPLNAKYAIPAYYLIAMAEASTNLAKYCGMRYGMEEELKGNFDEYFTSVRSKFFGEEAKRRIILGTFTRMAGFRDAYYLRAMKLRTLLIEEYAKLFKKFDLIVHPTMPVVAPKFDDIEKLTPLENYMMDICTMPANLAGLPHASIPVGKSRNMPVGLMLTASHLQEARLIRAANAIEGACG